MGLNLQARKAYDVKLGALFIVWALGMFALTPQVAAALPPILQATGTPVPKEGQSIAILALGLVGSMVSVVAAALYIVKRLVDKVGREIPRTSNRAHAPVSDEYARGLLAGLGGRVTTLEAQVNADRQAAMERSIKVEQKVAKDIEAHFDKLLEFFVQRDDRLALERTTAIRAEVAAQLAAAKGAA